MAAHALEPTGAAGPGIRGQKLAQGFLLSEGGRAVSHHLCVLQAFKSKIAIHQNYRLLQTLQLR